MIQSSNGGGSFSQSQEEEPTAKAAVGRRERFSSVRTLEVRSWLRAVLRRVRGEVEKVALRPWFLVVLRRVRGEVRKWTWRDGMVEIRLGVSSICTRSCFKYPSLLCGKLRLSSNSRVMVQTAMERRARVSRVYITLM